ncbi:unnamed protein product [Phytomonas sp. Hart1]|nr:unnamed protein product [Phytomonas sp. Hart1]|eukprot:CCW71082.1 unnamed protein product [Phytomonas sp. isolate Hart1]
MSEFLDEDVYAAFDPPDTGRDVWATDSVNPLLSSSSPTGGNALMAGPPSQWGVSGMGTAWGLPSSRLGTMGGGVASGVRPMTSNRAVGFGATGTTFDPTGQGRTMNLALGPAPPLKKRSENSPEELCMELEKQVNKLIEESAMLALQKDYGAALEKAKASAKKEKQLRAQREQLGLAEQINMDLTYGVNFNLAVQYQNHGLYQDALSTYNIMIIKPQFAQARCLRVNMGNIYATQRKYLMAIKMYRLTLDDTQTSSKELRYKLFRNIANCFVKMGQYRDAANSYESIFEGNGDVDAGFNLIISYYALGETEKMKRTFSKILNNSPFREEEEEDFDEKEGNDDVLVDDALRKEMKGRRFRYQKKVITAARLIAPVLDEDWRVGYDYLIEQLRQYEMYDSSSHMSSELEMCKCLNYLKHKRYQDAISGLRAFEKKDKELRARAATNLAYLYFLEGDYENGEKYSDMSLESNQYNGKALVNKGNFFFLREDYEKAKEYYDKALSVESDNMEAIYNLGLTAKRLGLYDEAIKMFKRVQMLVDSSEVLYQIADVTDLIGYPDALEWFARLIGRVPTDPNALARIGSLYAREGDETQAFHFYLEAYRYYQVNIDVILWLGAYFVKNEVYDKATQFFQRASEIQPLEVKWHLMVASCHRRRGDAAQAKRLYEVIHRKYPENVECLKYLMQLCKDGGLVDEANEWFKKMKELESRDLKDEEDDGNERGATQDGGDSTSWRGNREKETDSDGATAGRRAWGGATSISETTNGSLSKEKDTNKKVEKQKFGDDSDGDIELPGV